MFNRRIALGALAAFAAAPAVALGGEPTLEHVIARHVAARGGRRALDRVKRCRIKLDITEGGQTIQGVYQADISGVVRIDIRVDGQLVYREGVDRQGVWLWPGDEPTPRSSTAEGSGPALLHGIETNLVGFHRFAERGHKLRLMPFETIDGVSHPVVEVVFRTGHTSYFYFDPTSWMIVRKRDERAYHPDIDPTKKRVETRFSDFKTVDGVRTADRNEDYNLADGAVLAVNQVTERTWNPRVVPGAFDRTFTD